MPDPAATEMAAEAARPGPALSATSDAPPGFKDAIEAPAADPAPEPAPPVDSEPKPDQSDGTSGGTEGEADGQPDKQAGEESETPSWVKARVAREANKARAAEDRAAKLEADLSKALEAIERLTPKPPEPVEPERPRREQFDDPEAYDQALMDFAAQKAAAKARAETTTELQQQVQRNAERQVLDTHSQRAKSFAEAHPDYDELVNSDDLTITPAMTAAILSDGDGPAMAYHLGQNPEEAARIAKLPPALQLVEMGAIKAALKAPPPSPAPKPRPIEPLGARNTSAPDPDAEPMDAYGPRRLQEIRAQGRQH